MIKMYNKRKNGMNMEKCDCEKSYIENKKMIENYIVDKDIVINYDGYICKEAYENSDKKVLFILKESYTSNLDDFQNSSITKMLCSAYIKENGSFGEETNSNQMFDRLAMMAFALKNNNFNFDEIKKYIDESKQVILKEVAYINISKEPLIRMSNETKESNCKELKIKYEKYVKSIKQQIKILKPDIIIVNGKCANEGILSWILRDVFDKKLNCEERWQGAFFVNLDEKKNIKILFSYHPSYNRKKSKQEISEENDEVFITDLKERWDCLN